MSPLSAPPIRTRNVALPGFTIRTNVPPLTLQALRLKWEQARHPPTQISFINFINLYAGAGYRAAVPISELPRRHYRRVRAINNTQLSQFAAELTGETIELPDRALVFGSAFHCRILEPEQYRADEYCLRPSESSLLNSMIDALQKHPIAARILRHECERPIFWTDPTTNLPCKALIDQFATNRIIRDLKTTNAATQSEFYDHCVKFNYHRQLAFYASGASVATSTNVHHLEIIGVQKRSPFRIFICRFDQNTAFFQQGNSAYQHLLHQWQITNRPIGR